MINIINVRKKSWGYLMPKSDDDFLTNFKVEEIRRTYDHEVSRRTTLEAKASAIFALATVIVAIFTVILNFILSNKTIPYHSSRTLIGLSLISLIFVFGGLYYIRDVLKIKLVHRPYETHPNKILKKIDHPSGIIRDYRRSIYQTKRYNDMKVDSLNIANKLLVIGIGISFICLISLIVMWW